MKTRTIRVRPRPLSAAERALAAEIDTSGPPSSLGGAAWVTAAVVQYQHATDDSGVRPSALLRLALHRTDRASIGTLHETALRDWLRTELKGCELARSKASWALQGATAVGGAASLGKKLSTIKADLEKAIATQDGTSGAVAGRIRSGGVAARETSSEVGRALRSALDQVPTQELHTEAISEITGAVSDLMGEAVTSVTDVTDVVADVVDYLPGVAILTSAVKAAKSSVKLIGQSLKRRRYTQVADTSISVIEREATWSADYFEERLQAAEGVALGSALVTGAAHSLGYAGAALGPVAKAVTSVIRLTARIVQLVVDVLAVRRGNQRIRDGVLEVSHLRDTPVLGLCLPHLPGAHGLHVLGVVPPGWKATEHPDEASRLRAALEHPRNRALREALESPSPRLGGATLAAGQGALVNPWRYELKRLQLVLAETDRHAFDFPWKVVRGRERVYDPRAIGLLQRLKASGERHALAAWGRLKAIPETLGRPTTGPPVVTKAPRPWEQDWVLEDVSDWDYAD